MVLQQYQPSCSIEHEMGLDLNLAQIVCMATTLELNYLPWSHFATSTLGMQMYGDPAHAPLCMYQ